MAKGVAEVFRKRGVNLLYYYTAIQNVASILGRGILCRNAVSRLRICFRDVSLPSAQDRRSLLRVGDRPAHDFVPLFVNPLCPMFDERLRDLGTDLACVAVRIAICNEDGVFFTDGNLAYSEFGTRVYATPEEAKRLPWIDIMSTYGNNRLRGAEVLVPEKVEVRHMLYVFVTDPEDPTVGECLPAPPLGVTYHRFDSASVFGVKRDIFEELRRLLG